jgi:hypothetical protein
VDVNLTFKIDKSKSEGRYVSGWAYVCEKGSSRVADYSGDTATLSEITKAMHGFMLNARVAKHAHSGDQMGDIVEMVIVDDDFAKAIGATTDKRGAWIKMEVHNTDVRKAVVEGRLRMFSIGGSGKRKAIAA